MPNLLFLADPSGITQSIVLDRFPFILGREGSVNFVVPSQLVSKEHAAIVEENGEYIIRDLNSRNGTYVNGIKVNSAELKNGDVIQLAQSEFRFEAGAVAVPVRAERAPVATEPLAGKVPPSVLYGRPLLQEMLSSRAVRVVFQPIVDLLTGQTIAFESLGRGSFPELSTRPVELFRLASRCSLAVQLSRLLRACAVESAESLPAGAKLFCNLHPEEFATLETSTFEHLLEALPQGRQLVLEVHEDAVAEPQLLRPMRDFLHERGVALAYDDFGAGRSRLSELAEVPPDYIKLDMRLVRDIDRAGGRRDVVKAICAAATDLGVMLIAEGIERQEEADLCRHLGCRLGQGYLLGHPEIKQPTS